MELTGNPNVTIVGSFVHFADVDTLIACADNFIAYERAIYMKQYGLCYDDAQACAQMEYDTKLEIMSNSGKIDALIARQAAGLNTVFDHLGHEFKSISYMCKYWCVQPYTYMTRRRHGWNTRDALLGQKSDLTYAKMKESKLEKKKCHN